MGDHFLATMKSFLFASLIAGAAAFAPASQKQASSALSGSFDNELGAQAPLGFFDPLGLVKDYDQEDFDRLRYVEIKHGRIAMMAVVGFLVQESGIRFDGDIDFHGTSFASIPNGFKAFDAIPNAGLAQILLFIFFLEVGVMRPNPKDAGDFPGMFTSITLLRYRCNLSKRSRF